MQKRARVDDPSFSETSSPKRAASEDPSDQDTPSSSTVPPSSAVDQALITGGSQIALQDDDEPSSPPSIPTPTDAESGLRAEEQLTLIKNFKKQPLNVGDLWYLIDRRWYRRFDETLSASAPSPAAIELLKPVDNSRIATPEGQLKGIYTNEVDVEIVPQTAWDALKSWYGHNIEIQRKVIPGLAAGFERVEFYPPTVTVFALYEAPAQTTSVPSNAPEVSAKKPNAPFEYTMSAAAKYKALKSFTSRAYLSSPANSRLWKLDSSLIPDVLKTEDDEWKKGWLSIDQVRECGAVMIEENFDPAVETLESVNVCDGDILVLEPRESETSPWPLDPPGTASAVTAVKPLFQGGGYVESLEKAAKVNTPSSSAAPTATTTSSKGFLSMFTRSKTAEGSGPTEKSRMGRVGLSNLGNTCFMNSALQCLSNTTELNKYFLSGVFKEEINRSNPLGMKGQVADAFGVLITQLFLGSASSFSPSDFKRTIARFAPSFSGYQQHDSQELITFALDGLHEDLNRIHKKPYLESPDWNGGNDEDLAKMARICWDMYKKRNDSVIVDLFQGQYKSTLVCPTCGKEAITFDPFLYLTLPLPIKKKFQARVYFIHADPTKPRYQVDISVPKDSSFGQVKGLMGTWFKVDPETLLVMESYSGGFYKSYANHDPISEIGHADVIVFYEVGTKVAWRDDGWVAADDEHALIPVFSGTQKWRNDIDTFGAPFFITVTADQARDANAITDAVVQQYLRILPKSKSSDYYEQQSPVQIPSSSTPLDVFETPDGVAEIRLDGSTSSIGPSGAIDPSLTADSSSMPALPALGAPVSDIVTDGVDGDYPSPPADVVETINGSPMDTDPSTSSTPPVQPVFKLLTFADRLSPDSIPFGRRIDRPSPLVPSASDLYDASSSSSPNLYGSDGDDELPSVKASADKRPLLVKPGTGLVCIWDRDTVESAFGRDGEQVFKEGYEVFVDPSLEAENADKAKKKGKSVISIEDCLDEFSRVETLGQDDLWYCSNCKEHRAATKKLEIWKIPDILVVHLKRFGGARSMRDKIDNLIEFPVSEFDLEDRVLSRTVAKKLAAEGVDTDSLGLEPFDEPLLYDLYAVDQHYGGLGGGHYTALAKNVDTDSWYSFDDSRVSKIDESAIVTPAAYVLFYRRRTSRPIGGSSRVKAEQAEQLAREKAASAVSSPALPSSSLPPLPESGRASPVSSSTNSGDFVSRPFPHKISGLKGFMPGSFKPERPEGPLASPPASDEEVDMFSGGLGEGADGQPPSYDGGSDEAASPASSTKASDLGMPAIGWGGGAGPVDINAHLRNGETGTEGDIGEEGLREM